MNENTFDMILPVIMHFDTEEPNKYTEIARHGKIPPFLPKSISN